MLATIKFDYAYYKSQTFERKKPAVYSVCKFQKEKALR